MAIWLAAAGGSSASPPSVEAAAVALHSGNASNAVALATQALADASLSAQDRARVLVDRGLAHEMLGEHDGALADFTEAIDARALSPAELARALYDRGVALDEMGRTEDAVGDYAAVLRLDPRNAAALNNRGNAYRRLGRPAEARADYQASLAAGNPHAEYPNYGLGQIAEAQGRPDAARTYYRAALVSNPQFTLASERLAAIGAAPSGDAPIVLRPPQHAAGGDDGVVHLHPPGSAPHRAPVHQAAADPGLKPALNEGGAAVPGGSIQLGAWRYEADAADAWNRIVGQAGDLMAGLSPQVVPVDLPGRGRYYRLRAGPVDAGGAAGLCAALHARKVECLVVKG
ncbi:MAG: tetratricopeptide repeat protein [Rhizomicrobium sp.]